MGSRVKQTLQPRLYHLDKEMSLLETVFFIYKMEEAMLSSRGYVKTSQGNGYKTPGA